MLMLWCGLPACIRSGGSFAGQHSCCAGQIPPYNWCFLPPAERSQYPHTQYATQLDLEIRVNSDIIRFGCFASAGVVELADARDSKSRDPLGREGSTPSSGTIAKHVGNHPPINSFSAIKEYLPSKHFILLLRAPLHLETHKKTHAVATALCAN